MFTYTQKLKKLLIQDSYDEYYISLCIQYSERLQENGLPIIFDKEHLSLLLGITKEYLLKLIYVPERFYKRVDIPKKSKNEYRHLLIPTKNLKYIQRWILDNILNKIPLSIHSTGFRKELSIVDNAKPHVGQECLINLDIKDFFPSISFEKVFRIFFYYGYTKELSYLLAKLCTFENSLPQGAPTSPYISNIICLKLDKRLGIFAEKNNAVYTRYADDITISGSKSIVVYLDLFKRILTEEGFKCNSQKTRIKYRNEKQMVTGLVVNEKVKVPKQMKNYLRQQIYYCLRRGVYGSLKFQEKDKSNYKNHLYGLAYYIYMVEMETGLKFLRQLDEIAWDY